MRAVTIARAVMISTTLTTKTNGVTKPAFDVFLIRVAGVSVRRHSSPRLTQIDQQQQFHNNSNNNNNNADYSYMDIEQTYNTSTTTNNNDNSSFDWAVNNSGYNMQNTGQQQRNDNSAQSSGAYSQYDSGGGAYMQQSVQPGPAQLMHNTSRQNSRTGMITVE